MCHHFPITIIWKIDVLIFLQVICAKWSPKTSSLIRIKGRKFLETVKLLEKAPYLGFFGLLLLYHSWEVYGIFKSELLSKTIKERSSLYFIVSKVAKTSFLVYFLIFQILAAMSFNIILFCYKMTFHRRILGPYQTSIMKCFCGKSS